MFGVPCIFLASLFLLDFSDAFRKAPECNVRGCRECPDGPDTCAKCQALHKLTTDRRRCIYQCNSHLCRVCPSGICAECYHGYYLADDETCHHACLSNVPNCGYCDDGYVCSSCRPGYELRNNSCLKDSDGCGKLQSWKAFYTFIFVKFIQFFVLI
ncbi:hypothetical protein HELRODRAFT_174465 [Helobdella robusta]|uniref:TNFR-Cys domain-containing protein n=1 Tax=Helobdella robusta TaxID=6412 RepID=T1F853_HELRO|nr:hypothetical protein HELRODRAFT_174465 [Helobdella robusta]ESO01509.1 hypothetical protein HELRODRAFT_174465 [Helobdella robusta]